jgi:hypothetical protein
MARKIGDTFSDITDRYLNCSKYFLADTCIYETFPRLKKIPVFTLTDTYNDIYIAAPDYLSVKSIHIYDYYCPRILMTLHCFGGDFLK